MSDNKLNSDIVYQTKVHYYHLDCVELYPGSEIGRKLLKTDVDSYINSISHLIDKNKTLILNDHCESFDSDFLYFSNQIFKKLISEKKFDKDKLIIVSGGLPVKENFYKYLHHCKTNKLNVYPIIFNPYFQFTMATHIISSKSVVSNYIPSTSKTNLFLFLNGQPRTHRIYLLFNLFKRKILEKCTYSFFYSLHQMKDLIQKTKSVDLKEKILHQIDELEVLELPKILTINPDDRLSQHSISKEDLSIFDSTYISLIAETIFFKKDKLDDFTHGYWTKHLDGLFLTEKTFRAIACKHPFIIASRPHSLKALRQLGYQTFSSYIDESYDDIEDDYKRLDKILHIMENLSNKDQEFWDRFLIQTRPITEHNFELLKSNKKPYLYFPLNKSNL